MAAFDPMTSEASSVLMQNVSEPPLRMSTHIDAEKLQRCVHIMGMPVPMRVMSVKEAMIFGRQSVEPTKIRESYMTKGSSSSSSARNATLFDQFTKGFTITWGPDQEPVADEFKMEIGLFMVDALRAIDTYGFIPWKVRLIRSQTITGVREFYVPAVAPFGLWKVEQMLMPRGEMERIYRLSQVALAGDAASSSSKGGSNMFDDPATLNKGALDQLQAQTTNRWGGTWNNSSKGQKGSDGKKKRGLGDIMHTNQARDLDAALENGALRGVYMVKEPTVDGTPTSAAMSVVSLNERVSRLNQMSVTAAGVASNPMLVIGQPNGGSEKQAGVSAASSLLSSHDLTATRSANRIAQGHHDRLISDIHNESQAPGASAQVTATIYIDDVSRQRKMLMTRPFFEGNKYIVEPGYNVMSQPMPREPGNLSDQQQMVDERTAVIFGIPYSAAFGSERGNLKATAEAGQQMLQSVIEEQAARVAGATQWILNHIFHRTDTEELRAQQRVRQSYLRTLESIELDVDEEDEEGDDDENGENGSFEERADGEKRENIEDMDITSEDVLDTLQNPSKAALKLISKSRRTRKQKALRKDIEAIQRYIDTPARYVVKFATHPPPPETISMLSERGMINRRTEAALMASSIGISPSLIELQQEPDKYRVSVMTAEAKAKNTGKPKPGEKKKSSEKKKTSKSSSSSSSGGSSSSSSSSSSSGGSSSGGSSSGGSSSGGSAKRPSDSKSSASKKTAK